MATWSNQSPTSATWTTIPFSDSPTPGSPIGLLLALTYEYSLGSTSWSNSSPNSASWSNVSPN